MSTPPNSQQLSGMSTPLNRQRSRSTSPSRLQSTPKSAAKTLGRRRSISTSSRLSPMQESSDSFEMSESPQHSFDPRGPFYQVSTVGEGGFSDTMQQDLIHLAALGFNIDISEQGKLGFGFFGVVYKGIYGKGIKGIKDKDGKPVRNVAEGLPFAVKYVDFRVDSVEPSSEATKAFGAAPPVQDTANKRESYEVEKNIMTMCNHPNIVPIRMAINMGVPKTYQYRGSDDRYVQHDRVYLVLDFAQLGSLMTFMNKNAKELKPTDRIKMVRDLFWGMKYLHDNGIVHGDVHTGNVLIFKEDGEMVSKWADFGLAEVTVKKEYVFTSRGSNPYGPRFEHRMKDDCRKMGGVLWHIWRGRQRDKETEDIRELCDQHMKLVDTTKVCHNLEDVLKQFRKTLFYRERIV